MVCDLGIKDLIRGSIQNAIAKDPRTNGIEENSIYPATESLLAGLNDIGTKHGSSLYVVEPGGEEIRVYFNIPDSVVQSYQQSQTGRGRTAFQRQTANDKSPETLDSIADGLRQAIGTNSTTLTRFAENVLLASRRASKDTQDADLRTAMSEVWTTLKQDPDGIAKLKMIGQFISEAAGFTKTALTQLSQLDFNDPNLVEPNEIIVFEVEKQVDQYAPIITDFYESLATAPESNPVAKVIKQAHDDLRKIKAIAANVHKDSVLGEMIQTLNPSFERAKADYEAQVSALRAKYPTATPGEKRAIDKKIKRLTEAFNKLSPSAENVTNTIIGKASDASVVNKYILAGAMNPDLLVQGFARKIKAVYAAAQDKFRQIGADMGAAYNEWLNSGGRVGNVDKAFEPLYDTVKEYYYDEESGEVLENNTLYFRSETSEQWRTEFTKMKANLSKLGHTILKARQNGATPEELSPMEEEYDLKKAEYIAWRRDNFESEYDDRYHAVDKILDEVVTYGDRKTTLRDIRSAHFETIAAIQARYAISGIPSEEDILELNTVRNTFESIKNPIGKVGEELRIAELFQKHAAGMKEMTEKWDITPDALDRFNTRKAVVDKRFDAGEITQEERDRWYVNNTTTVYDPKYWIQRRMIVARLNALSDEMLRITGQEGKVSLKDAYERMELLCRKYRDHRGHIDGRNLTDAERAEVLKIEQDIEDVKQATKSAYSGFLGEEFESLYQENEATKNALAEEIRRLRKDDPSNSKSTRDRIAEIRARLRDMRGNEKKLAEKFLAEKGIKPEDIASFSNLYEAHRKAIRELSDLTESSYTDFYYETFAKELNLFVAAKSTEERQRKFDRTNTLRIDGKKFKKDGDEFKEILLDGTFGEALPFEAVMDHLFRKEFEGSDWYQKNHFESERWDRASGEMVTKSIPIYAWRIAQPTEKGMVKEHAPNISWRRRVIKDEYRNPAYATSLDGLPPIKAGLHKDESYEIRRSADPALWKFRDYMIEQYLSAQRDHIPSGRAMGMRVPAIERNFSGYDALQRGFKGYGEHISRSVKIVPQDVDEGLYKTADESGYERKFIPVKFQGRLDESLTSRNIMETVGQYVGQAQMYTARNELLQFGKSIEQTLSFQNHAPSSDTLDKTAKYFGIFKRNKKRGSNERLDTIRNMIDMFVYGETVGEKTLVGKKAHKILGNLLGLRAGGLFSELPIILNKLAGGAADLGASGWSQLVNLLGGYTQQIIKSQIKSGNARFSLSDWAWAKKEYAVNSAYFVNDIGKISGRSFWTEFAEFFDAHEQHYVDHFGKQIYSKGLLRQINLHNLSFWKNAVEHELSMTTVMAFARGHFIDVPVSDAHPTGKVSLQDAFKVENGRLIPTVEISQDEITKARGYLAALLRDINGNYGKLDRTFMEQYAIGKSIAFMRKWMIPMFVTRFGDKKYSVEQDRVVEGYIRQSAELAIRAVSGFGDTGFRGIGSIFLPEIGVNLTEDEKDALKRTRSELLIMLMMYLAYKVVLGYDDKDKDRFKKLEKESYWVQGLTYSLVKAQSEQSTFIPPYGFSELGKLRDNLLTNTNPVISDAYKIMAQDINWDGDPTFFERYKRDTPIHQKGDLKAAADLWKMIGLTTLKQDPVEALRSFEFTLNK